MSGIRKSLRSVYRVLWGSESETHEHWSDRIGAAFVVAQGLEVEGRTGIEVSRVFVRAGASLADLLNRAAFVSSVEDIKPETWRAYKRTGHGCETEGCENPVQLGCWKARFCSPCARTRNAERKVAYVERKKAREAATAKAKPDPTVGINKPGARKKGEVQDPNPEARKARVERMAQLVATKRSAFSKVADAKRDLWTGEKVREPKGRAS